MKYYFRELIKTVKEIYRLNSKVKKIKFFERQFKEFKISADNEFQIGFDYSKVSDSENTAYTSFDRHYIYHVSWAIRKLIEIAPEKHTDISSILYLPAVLSAFMKVDYYDLRKPKLFLKNLSVKSADLLNLPFEDESIESLSCLHSIEHVGLGRYGDAIDFYGDRKSFKQLARVLKKKGNLLIAVPVAASNKVVFNLHRIYSYNFVVNYMKDQGLKLKEFTLIPDKPTQGHLVTNPSAELLEIQQYGCGCFWFIKE